VRGFLVDTNVLSEFSRRGEPDQRVKSWLKAAAPGALYVRRREQLEQWLEKELLDSFDTGNMLPVTKSIGYRWAALSARAQAKGIQPAVIDGLVAATALEYDLTLATRNVKDFAGLGVEIFNPWEIT
jgi:toxin FitB